MVGRKPQPPHLILFNGSDAIVRQPIFCTITFLFMGLGVITKEAVVGAYPQFFSITPDDTCGVP